MASLVLVGTALALGATSATFGGALVLAAAGIAGSFIDNNYLFPPGGGQEAQHFEVEGPRVGGVQVQSGADGSPMAYCRGAENRIAGQIIWAGELIEDKQVNVSYGPHVSGGLKGGGGSSSTTSTTYSYFQDLAIALCEGEIEGIDKVWADGNAIYTSPELVNVTSNLISAVAFTDAHGRRFTDIISPPAGPDLTNFRSGVDVTMSGWGDPNLDTGPEILWRVAFTELEQATGNTIMRIHDVDGDNGDAQGNSPAGPNVTISQVPPQFNFGDAMDFRVYNGDLSQLPDPLIEAAEGAGNVPGFRGTAYVVIERLLLQNFGNRIPQFTFLVRQKTDLTVEEAIQNIVTRGGNLELSEVDASEAAGDTLRGMAAAGPQPGKRLLSPIMKAFNLVSTERNGQLIFRKRGNQVCQTIDAGDLAAHEPGQGASRPFTITDSMTVDLPSEVTVKFIEPKLDYQPGMARERKLDSPAQNTVIINLPIAMTQTQAKEIARRTLWLAHQNRQVITITVPPKYIDLEVEDLIDFAVDDELFVILIKKIDRGKDWTISIEGVVEYVAVNTQTGEEDEEGIPGRSIFIAGELIFEIIDIAPFSDNEMNLPGVYMGTAKYDPAADFGGSEILKSTDGQNFFKVGNFNSEFVAGYVPVPTPGGPHHVFDLTTEIDVVMRNGSISSVTELEMLNGANRAVLGNEVIGFQNATLISQNTYRISKLMRGLRDTEGEVYNHSASNERFIVLDQPGLQFFQMADEEIGLNRDFKSLPPDKAEGTVPAFMLTPFESNTLRMFRPSHITGQRDASNNLTIRWVRATRARVRHFSGNYVPLLETRERYLVEIRNVSDTATVREIVHEGPPVLVYTTAQMVEDGIGVGAPVTVRISQYSERLGPGKTETETI